MNADADFCYLTTVGRVTGTPHEIEIWFATPDAGATLYLLSGGGDRAYWVRNLVADPRVTVRVEHAEFEATARVIDDADEGRRAAELVFDKYQPRYSGDLTRWRDTALPIAITLGP